MDQKFLFMIFDKGSFGRNGAAIKEAYVHPSTDTEFAKLQDAVLMVHDLVDNPKKGIQSCSTSNMIIKGEAVQFSAKEDRVSELLFLVGITVGQDLFQSESFLTGIASVMSFLSADLRRSLLDAHFRSDVDGMVISAIHSSFAYSPLGDLTLAVGDPKVIYYSDAVEETFTSFEAGDLFDQKRLSRLTRNIFVMGSCLFVNDLVVASHLPDAVFRSVNLFMRFHRKGFRRIKRGSDAAVIQIYPQPVCVAAVSRNLEYYFFWINKGDIVLGTSIEICPTSDQKEHTELLDVVIGGLRAAMGQIDCSLRDGDGPRTVLSHTQKGLSSRTLSLISDESKTSTDSSRASAALGKRFSGDMKSDSAPFKLFTTPASSVSKNPAPPHLIYAVKILSASNSAHFVSFLGSHRKDVPIPPSLQYEFFTHISILRVKSKSKSPGVREISVMLEYPPPALIKKYWITWWSFMDPQREIFICYPNGADSEALFFAMTF